MPSRNFGLDVVRAVAIGAVLAGHFLYGPYAAYAPPPWVSGYLGLFGVELFFVLSGYLVGRIMLRVFEGPFDGRTILNFYQRRWMRTVPAYLVVMVAEAWWTASSPAGIGQELAAHSLYLLFLQNFAWPAPAWYGVTWSLAVEEWFYLLFPIAFVMLAAVGVARRVLAASVACVVLCLLARLWIYVPGMDWDAGVRKVVLLRLDAISFGVLWAILAARFAATLDRLWWVLGLAGLACTAVVASLNSVHETIGLAFFYTFYFSVVPFVMALLVPAAERCPWPGKDGNPLRLLIGWLSRHAYVLYLSHMLILGIMQHYKAHNSILSALLVYAVACAAVATLLHRLVEKPIMDRRPRELSNRFAGPSEGAVRASCG